MRAGECVRPSKAIEDKLWGRECAQEELLPRDGRNLSKNVRATVNLRGFYLPFGRPQSGTRFATASNMAKIAYVLLPLLLAGVGTTFACSTPESTPETDKIMVDASPETRSQIGVAAWGFDIRGEVGEPTTMVVHGYDDAHARMFEYAQSRPGSGILRATLDANGTKVTLALRKSDESNSDVVENSFKEDDTALRILSRLAADLKRSSPPSDGPSRATSSPADLGLHLTDGNPLVPGNGEPLTNKCVVLLPESANWPTECALRPLGAKCQTPPATDSSAQCDRVGDPVCPDGFVLGKSEYDSKKCSRIDGIHKDRGEQLLPGKTNCTAAPQTGETSSTTTKTIDKRITIETSTSKKVTFGATAEVQVGYEEKAEATVELASVSTTLSTQLKLGASYSNEDTTSAAQATAQGEQFTQTYIDKNTTPIPSHKTHTRYVENEVVDYTLVSFTRTNNIWVKNEGKGRVQIPVGERLVEEDASCGK